MRILRSVTLLALASAALSAHAVVIDFEDLAGTGVPNPDMLFVPAGTYDSYGVSVVSGGFLFVTPGVDGLASFNPNVPNANPIFNYTGSLALFDNTQRSGVQMSKVGGEAFSVQSIQVAPLINASGLRTFTFTGTLAGGGTVSQTSVVSFGPGLATIKLFGFSGLTSFSMPAQEGDGPSYQFDNIAVNGLPSVPGPAAALAFGVGLIRRRKRA
jgi:hypothetical protein